MTADYDVIIVGAGQAGSAAAHRLALRHRRSVLLLEASDHVGGRTRNLDLDGGSTDRVSDHAFELGGTWISPDHTAILDLCRELGLEVYNASFLSGDGERPDEDGHCEHWGDAHGSGGARRRRDGRSSREEEVADWPWWFWGVDYSPEEMGRINKIVFHMDTDGAAAPRKVTFSSPAELTEKLTDETLAELERVGNRIKLDGEAISSGGKSCWDFGAPRRGWSQLDEASTREALGSILSTPDAKAILRNVILNKNAQEADRVSYLFNLISFAGCNSSGPDTQYRVRGGTQALPLRIAELLRQDSERSGSTSPVLVDSAVESIRITEDTCSQQDTRANPRPDFEAIQGPGRIEVQTRDGRIFSSRAVIVTGSPHAVNNIDVEPNLPAIQSDLLENMPMGRSMKFAAVYHKGPWWRKFGLQGDIISSGLPRDLSFIIPDNGNGTFFPIFGYCFDTSTYSQQYGILTCFIEGLGQVHFASLSEGRRRELFRKFLRTTFEDLVPKPRVGEGDSSKPIWEPDDYIVGNWGPENEFIGGAYTSYFPPHILSKPTYWDAYRQLEKLPNVFFAGADYHAGYGNGYMEGAVRSGQQVAELIHHRFEKASGIGLYRMD